MLSAIKNHVIPVIAAMGGIGAVGRLIWTRMSSAIGQEFHTGAEIIMSSLSLPEDRALAQAALASLKAHFPEGDKMIATAAAAGIVKSVPELAPFQGQIVSGIVAIEALAQKEVEKGIQVPAPTAQ